MNPLVSCNNICFSHGSQTILQSINLTVNCGDFLAVIGPNGGGKTTLVKLILGLLQPQSGQINICGQLPQNATSMVGYVPQYIDHNASFPSTALDVVLMGLFQPQQRLIQFFSFDHKKKKRQKALKTLAELNVENLAKRKISELSGGQRQRVLIARALVAEPELLILDEPTASLDTQAQTAFFELLQEINKKCTILVVSHDLMAIATYAKSVACVNRTLHYHTNISSSGELLEAFYATTSNDIHCPVELLREQLPLLQKEISPYV